MNGQPKKSYTFQMTLRCAIFLGLLAALAGTDYFILQDQIKSHQFDAELISLAGRQRMLFERTALLARYLVTTQDKRERANIRLQLLEAIDQLNSVEETLMRGSPKTGSRKDPAPEAVRNIYVKKPVFLHTRLQNYLTELKVLAATRDEDLKRGNVRLVYIRTVASGKILKALDAVVAEYQKQSEAKINRTQKLQRWVLESTLLALLILGIYLFRPMIRHVHQKMDTMEELNHALEERGEALRTANLQLEKLALLDPLTELLNRRGLQKALTVEMQRMERGHSDLHALLIDLDDFKGINDTLGYPVGDIVLKEIGARLRQGLRSTDSVARIGGDEFMVLLPQSRRAEGLRVAEKIRFAIAAGSILLSSGKSVKVTACMGMIEVSTEVSSIDELLSQIHPMLRKSKQSGKNRVSLDSASKEPGLRDLAFRAHFDAAIQDHRLYALRQPIIDLSDASTSGYEFLSRSSIEGFELPDDFFRVCLESNILTLVDHQCFKNCVQAGSGLPAGIRRHLNLFPSTLINVPPADLIAAIPPQGREKNYCIEISEQQIIGDPSYLSETVREIKRANILIGIDDVGFGRSCLESLILLEPDIVKIDKKCVRGIAQDKVQYRALKKLLQVAAALDAEVIAEGIETQDDLAMVRDLGVRFGQGYLWGQPSRCAH